MGFITEGLQERGAYLAEGIFLDVCLMGKLINWIPMIKNSLNGASFLAVTVVGVAVYGYTIYQQGTEP